MQHWGLYVWLMVFYENNHMTHHEKLCCSVDKWQYMQSHYGKLQIILMYGEWADDSGCTF